MAALLLDLGNTRWKFAVARDGVPGSVISGEYHYAGSPLDALRAQQAELDGVDGIYLAAVASAERTRPIVQGLQGQLGLDVHQVTATQAMPNVRSGYRRPDQLGVDRLMAMVAARAVTRDPLCVIDAGTAVTLDFVESDGCHLGGFILPGVRLFRECLLANTSIPRDSEISEGDSLGRDTPTAVALGARYAVSGIVESFLSGRRALFGQRHAELIIGGGDAESFTSLLPTPYTKLEHLVLRGLAVIAATSKRAGPRSP